MHSRLVDLQRNFEGNIDIKSTIIGPGRNQSKEVRVLSRIIRYVNGRIENEADQRHAKIIVKEVLVREEGVLGVQEKGSKKMRMDREEQKFALVTTKQNNSRRSWGTEAKCD